MTISTQTSQATLLGNGVTTVFNFSFVWAASSDIQVTYTNTSGISTVLSPSQYTLNLNAAAAGALWGVGGTVTYPTSGSPIPNGSSLTIARVVPLTQTITISNQGDFYPQSVEQAMDLLCMEIQQLSGRTTQFLGTWQTGQTYTPGDIVQDGANGADTLNYYICLVANTSGVWATDLANGDWALSVQAIVPVTNQPITLSGAVTGTGTTSIVTTIASSIALPGAPTAATPTTGTDTTQIATTAFVQNTVEASFASGGFVNKFRNPNMDIWQRGTSLTATNGTRAYMADGWQVLATGANATVAKTNVFSVGATTSMQLTGNTGMTDTYIATKIESYLAGQLLAEQPSETSNNCTVQFCIYNNTGAALVPTLTIQHATAQDNFGGVVTDVAGASLQSIPNGTIGLCAYTWAPSALSGYGLQFYLDFAAALNANTKALALLYADVRSTPNVAVGLNNNPPLAEFRPIAAELPFNQRYFCSSYGNNIAPGTATHAGMVAAATGTSTFAFNGTVNFPVQMRATPTLSYWDGAGNSGRLSATMTTGSFTFTDNTTSTPAPGNISVNGFMVGSNGVTGEIFIHYSASAEL